MKKNHQAIIDAALALPEPEHLALAKQLMETLPPKLDDFTDEEWLAGLERRHSDFVRGKADAVPWSQLKKQAKKALWQR